MAAPLIVFAYNRPDHLKKTLTALSENPEARVSELFLFVDGPKNEAGLEANRRVREVAVSFASGYFRSVTIRAASENKGLARSVIEGVSEVLTRFDRVIVTEDDAVCSPYYLRFMNEALEYYRTDETVWSIGGYTVPLLLPEEYHDDVLLTQRCSSYAWATWKDRWERVDWEMRSYPAFRWGFRERRAFNRWGDDRSLMLDDQMEGRINSWAIRFDYAMFCSGMYNILPRYSLIHSIGHDGSGTHSGADAADPFRTDLKKALPVHRLIRPAADERIRRAYRAFFRCGRLDRLKLFLKHRLLQNRRKGATNA